MIAESRERGKEEKEEEEEEEEDVEKEEKEEEEEEEDEEKEEEVKERRKTAHIFQKQNRSARKPSKMKFALQISPKMAAGSDFKAHFKTIQSFALPSLLP